MAKVRQAARFATAGAIGAGLLVLSGLTLTGTVIVLVMATPLLVVFSPILVPAAAAVALVAAGLLLSGGFGVAAVSSLVWIYNYNYVLRSWIRRDHKAVCTEAGMFALRERRVHVTQDDFEMAVAKVMKKETEKNMSLRKLWK